MSAQDEMDRVILDLERQVDRLKAIRAQQLMQVTASPRVVAGPLRLVPTGEPQGPLSLTSAGMMSDKPRILTHPARIAPCLTCDDDGRPDGEAA